MKKISKVLSLLLAVLMMFSVISISAVAAGTYTVKYNANGGSGSMASTTFTVDEENTLRPNAFKKTGHTFIGWGESKTATEPKYADKQSVVNIAGEGETVTLYALWRANTYFVEFRANGGKGTMENQEFKYGEQKALAANTFTRDGYTFLGWSKNNTSASATYVDQKTVKNLSPNDGAVVVLYAVWKKNPVTVTEIFVKSEPTKTEYFVGDAFDAAGLSIGVNLSDNTVQTITSGFDVATPDMTTAGEKVVTVTYEGQTTTFTINVVEKPAEPEYNYTFSIVAPENKEVAHGESVVLSAKLEGTYPAGVYVGCTANNNNFAATLNADGSYTVTAEGVGATVFTATLYAADGTVLAQDTVELTALAEVVPEEPTEPDVPEEPTEPDVPEEPTEPEEPTDPEEPSCEVDIMGILMSLVSMLMGYLQPVIDFVMGLIA